MGYLSGKVSSSCLGTPDLLDPAGTEAVRNGQAGILFAVRRQSLLLKYEQETPSVSAPLESHRPGGASCSFPWP